MGLPTNVADWTYEMVIELVQTHEYEPGYFDYKDALNPTKGDPKKQQEHLASIRRTVCAMANTGGGVLLFGIRDRRHRVASPLDRIIGIPLASDLLREFGQKIADLQPVPSFTASPRPITLPDDSDKGLFVVLINDSPLRPHMVRSTGAFYTRGGGGTAEPMGYYEVREQMLYSEERLRKLTLFRLEIAQHRQLVERLFQEDVTNTFRRFDTTGFKVLLADVCGLIPPSTAFLAELLEIPATANFINELLDRHQRGGTANTMLRESVHGNLRQLRDLCLKAEERFTMSLGPLGTGGS
jgi:hypothetical protein